MRKEKDSRICSLYLSILLLLMITTGCNEQGTALVQTETPTVTRTSLPLRLTPTPTNVITTTKTSFPTPTPVSREQANPIILELLETNGGCDLPCWWGINPGQTTWEEAKAILYPLVSKIGETEIVSGISATAYFEPLPAGIKSTTLYVGFFIQEGTIQSIDVYGLDGVTMLELTGFLGHNGEPDEIWVDAYNRWSVDSMPNTFVLHFFYPSKGIFVQYDDTACDTKNDMAICCVEGGPVLALWSPEKVVSYKEAIELSGLSFDPDFPFPNLTVMEAFGMSKAQFYQTYKNPNQPSCFETPRQLWRYWATATPKP